MVSSCSYWTLMVGLLLHTQLSTSFIPSKISIRERRLRKSRPSSRIREKTSKTTYSPTLEKSEVDGSEYSQKVESVNLIYDDNNCPTSQTTIPLNPDDDLFRSVRQNVPVKFQYFLRDSGVLRFLMDQVLLVFALAPSILKMYPTAVSDFLNLSGYHELSKLAASSSGEENQQNIKLKVNFSTTSYGPYEQQVVHTLRPAGASTNRKGENEKNENMIAFVHGGAWGSGNPAMYRLVATPFLERGLTVAIIGYRTYPTATAEGQVKDLSQALEHICEKNADITLISHSTGAHISMLGLLTGELSSNVVDRFVGLAGVYDIPSHYLHEMTRGIERFSPLAKACGITLSEWKNLSPTRLVANQRQNSQIAASISNKLEKTTKEGGVNLGLPPMLICHGVQDDVVPCQSAISFHNALSQVEVSTVECTLELLEEAGHQDFVIDLMFGGPSGDVVLDWLEEEGIGSA